MANVVLLANSSIDSTEQPSNIIKSFYSWLNYGLIYDLICIISTFALAIGLSFLKPFELPIDPSNADISHPHKPDIVPNWLMIILGVILPICTALLYYIISYKQKRCSLHDASYSFYIFFIGCTLAVSISQFMTNLVKNWAGRLRPDFLARCQYNSTMGECTGNTLEINDGRRSFWSGHAAISFSGLGFFALWISGIVLTGKWAHNQVHAQNGYLKDRPGRVWRFVLPVFPILLATYIAISRTQQFVHFPTDVITGSAVGFLWALLSYFFYYRVHCIKSYQLISND